MKVNRELPGLRGNGEGALFLATLAIVFTCSSSGVSFARTCEGDLYVAVTGDPVTGDGSGGNPYRTITKAVDRAREIRSNGCADPIIIHVGPGGYLGSTAGTLTLEALPIVLDFSYVELRGSTILDTDERGLPTGTSSSATTLTDVVPAGHESLSALILVKPGARVPTSRVTISGFMINGDSAVNDIAIDRTQGFTIRGNVITFGGPAGVFTRASSGLIEANYLFMNSLSAGLTGGNSAFPANLTVTRNRFIGGQPGEDPLIIVNGAGDIIFPLAPGDPQSTTTEVFDTIAAAITDNDASSSTNSGIQLMSFGIAASSSETHVTATISNNILDKDAFGLMITGGFPYRALPRRWSGTLTAKLENNVISHSTFAPALATFNRLDAVQPIVPDNGIAFKYLQDSSFNIRHTGELDGVWIDHPAQDPVDCRTLCNHLRINRMDMLPPIRSIELGPAFPSACPPPTACEQNKGAGDE